MIETKRRRQPVNFGRVMPEYASPLLGRGLLCQLRSCAILTRSRFYRRVGLITNVGAFVLWVTAICLGPPAGIAWCLGLAAPALGWVDYDFWAVFGIAGMSLILGVWIIHEVGGRS